MTRRLENLPIGISPSFLYLFLCPNISFITTKCAFVNPRTLLTALDFLWYSADMFESIGVVGVGQIGSFISRGIKDNYCVSVVGVDSDQSALEKASSKEYNMIDYGSTRLRTIADSDLVILAAPPLEIINIIPKLVHLIRPDALVMDTGSTKVEIRNAVLEANRKAYGHRLRYVGGHPMAGTVGSGVDAAYKWMNNPSNKGSIFQGKPFVFTPSKHTREDVSDLIDFLEPLGIVPVVMSATKHDSVVAYISHLVQLEATAEAATVADHAKNSSVYSGLAEFHHTMRIAGSPFELWRQIFLTNKGPILQAHNDFSEILSSLRWSLKSSNLQRIKEASRQARQFRRTVKTCKEEDSVKLGQQLDLHYTETTKAQAGAYAFHLPWLVAVALTLTAAEHADSKLCAKLATGGFRDTTRLASRPFDSAMETLFKESRELIFNAVGEFTDNHLSMGADIAVTGKANDIETRFHKANQFILQNGN